jgi:hypothetical protein
MMIRRETSADIHIIRELNDLVFQGPVEGTIVVGGMRWSYEFLYYPSSFPGKQGISVDQRGKC